MPKLLTEQDPVLRYDATKELKPEEQAQACKNIGARAVLPTDEVYFGITEDGTVYLQPEYRGEADEAASADPEFEKAISDNGVGVAGSQNDELPEDIVIPDVVNGVAVTALAYGMFAGNKRVKRVTLPKAVTHLPWYCFGDTWNLIEVIGTEQIKTMEMNIFHCSGIHHARFPNITSFTGGSQFNYCCNLKSVEFNNQITSITKNMFSGCERLEVLRGFENIKSVGNYGCFLTSRLKSAPFANNNPTLGTEAMHCSRADWIGVNDIDYSDVTFTPCRTPMRSTFSQHDPRWVDKKVVEAHSRTYAGGCVTVSAAMIYSAMMGVDMESPEEFVTAVGAANAELLKKDVGMTGNVMANIVSWLNAVGLTATSYDGCSKTNVQAMYDALADGAMVLAVINSSVGDNNHAAVLHGINTNGELLVTDPSNIDRMIGVYDACTYPMPINTRMREDDYFAVVTK